MNEFFFSQSTNEYKLLMSEMPWWLPTTNVFLLGKWVSYMPVWAETPASAGLPLACYSQHTVSPRLFSIEKKGGSGVCKVPTKHYYGQAERHALLSTCTTGNPDIPWMVSLKHHMHQQDLQGKESSCEHVSETSKKSNNSDTVTSLANQSSEDSSYCCRLKWQICMSPYTFHHSIFSWPILLPS